MNWGPERLGNWPKVAKESLALNPSTLTLVPTFLTTIAFLPPCDHSMRQTVIALALLGSAPPSPMDNGRALTHQCFCYM